MNLAKDTVPIKDKIPKSKITSKKASVFNKIDKIAIMAIRLTPIASMAIIRSGMDGPLQTLYRKRAMATAKTNNAPNSSRLNIPGHPHNCLFKGIYRFDDCTLGTRHIHSMDIKKFTSWGNLHGH